MNKLIIHADEPRHTVSKHLYGHFAEHLGRCIYEGIWVGEDSPIPNTRGIRNDVVAALRKLKMPNVRWPGGCFADTYHWKDGIGPRAQRPSIANVWWGGSIENNHFGTHEFLDFCEQVGTEPYICGNVGSGSVQEMAEWLEYLTAPGDTPMARLRRANGRDEPWKIRLWAVGNENWGCGGNMTPLQYAQEYRRYQTYCRHYGGGELFKVGCGGDDAWNDVFVRETHHLLHGLSIHHYTIPGPWEKKGSATQFAEEEYWRTIQKAREVEKFIRTSSGILDRYDPAQRIALVLDEWGTWWDVEPGTNSSHLYQQNTMRDALVAALYLHLFHKYSDRLRVANIAQTINVLQAMCLTDGPRMIVTPTYHVFEMLKGHQDATHLPLHLTGSEHVSAAATRGADGVVRVSLANFDLQPVDLTCDVRGINPGKLTGRILTADRLQAHNTFDQPDRVRPDAFTDFSQRATTFTVKLPAHSLVVWEAR